MSINLNRVQNLIEKLAFISSVPNELTRLAFTEEDEKAHNMIIELCKEYDLSIRRDSIGIFLFVRQVKTIFYLRLHSDHILILL